jgi:peptidoglycan-associated lipoprotein
MNRTRLVPFSLASAALALTLACPAAKPVDEKKEPPPVPKAEAAKPAEDKPAVDPAAAAFRAKGQAELDLALAQLKNVTVFFAFDEATLTKDAQEKLTAVADVLSRHPELDVKIEGNADERGTAQYNLALGQKRADSVKKYLANLGVKGEQIKAVSFGSEKPVDPGHGEDAWAKNRRADVATTPDAEAKLKAEAKAKAEADAKAAPK